MPGWLKIKSADWDTDENGNPIKEEPLKNGDTFIVILEKIHIGDNKEWAKAAKINISFKFESKNISYDKSVGTFTDVQDDQTLSIENLVLLPPTKVEDYLNITVNIMELDAAEGLLSKAPTVLQNVRGIFSKIPLPETATNTTFDVIGNVVNIAASLNEDDVILRKQVSFFVKDLYPGIPPSRHFLHRIIQA